MKIAPRTVEAFLANPAAQCRAALLYGPDMGLTRDRARRIREAVLGAGGDPMAYAEFEEAKVLSDPALLSDELSAMGLLASRRVIAVRDASDKLTKIIEEALPSCHADAFLLVISGELPSRSSMRTLFEKEHGCAAVASYRDEMRDVQSVIRKKLDEAGVKLDRDSMEYLAQQLGNDRYVTYQELEKIITFAGDSKQLSFEDAQSLVDYNKETNMDDIVSAVADKNLKQLEKMLAVHLREGIQPVTYLRALQRYFNRLYFIRAKMASGLGAEEAIQGLKPPVFFKQLPHLTRHVQQWNTSQIVKALRLLIEAELASKTSDLPPAPASGRKLMQVTQVR